MLDMNAICWRKMKTEANVARDLKKTGVKKAYTCHGNQENTGCPRSKFAKVIGYIWRLERGRPKVGKAKIRLKNIHFTY